MIAHLEIGQGVVISLQGVMIAHHGIVIFLETADRRYSQTKCWKLPQSAHTPTPRQALTAPAAPEPVIADPWLLAATGPVAHAGAGGYVGTSMIRVALR
jgi:hypothetical protein